MLTGKALGLMGLQQGEATATAPSWTCSDRRQHYLTGYTPQACNVSTPTLTHVAGFTPPAVTGEHCPGPQYTLNVSKPQLEPTYVPPVKLTHLRDITSSFCAMPCIAIGRLQWKQGGQPSGVGLGAQKTTEEVGPCFVLSVDKAE